MFPSISRQGVAVAYFRKHGAGWQANIERRGVKRAQTFQTKAAAVAWAGQLEAEIMAGYRGDIPNLTVSAVLDRYIKEVSPNKKGARWEIVRLEALKRDRIAQVRLRQLDTPHMADWQQRRLQAVSAASVRRERNLINNVFQLAVKEWKWLKMNPFDGVRRPKDGKARERIATQDELDRLMGRASPNMARVITFAVETGMRQGEIAGLRACDINGRVAKLVDTKNGTSREVPLSEEALRVIGEASPTSNPRLSRAEPMALISAATNGVPGKVSGQSKDEASRSSDRSPTIFSLTADSISQMFRLLCKECKIEGLTFHDLRATAATRLAKRLNPMQLAKVLGHKNLKMLMVYYRESVDDIAELLNGPAPTSGQS